MVALRARDVPDVGRDHCDLEIGSRSVQRLRAAEIWVVYDGLPAATFSRAAVAAEATAFRERFSLTGRRTACAVGRLKWTRKGQEVFIRAAALLKPRYPDARYLVIGTAAPGSEDHLARFEALAEELGVRENIVFTGDLLDTRPAYAAVDASVVPSVDPEPFGCVVSESMALETPVAGSDAAGIAEQIVHGDSGFLFPPGDAQALAVALAAIFADPSLRQRLARGGRERS